MKPLSGLQAATCESSTRPRCTCRCGGALHGANRALVVAGTQHIDADQALTYVRGLPADDPHFAPRPRSSKQESQA